MGGQSQQDQSMKLSNEDYNKMWSMVSSDRVITTALSDDDLKRLMLSDRCIANVAERCGISITDARAEIVKTLANKFNIKE
jgi:hypothetical protein